MFENIILGIIQGVAEWLPISSEGMIILAKKTFFPSEIGLNEMIKLALFLHFGTFLAAAIYFYKDVIILVQTLFAFKKSSVANQKLFIFLLVTTLISGVWGLTLLKFLTTFAQHFESNSRWINLIVGAMLFVTAGLELRSKKDGYREIENLKMKDSIILGIIQGFAAIPGLSRSGLTVSTLLLSKFNKTAALKLSFLMSLPLVLAGNILLNISDFTFSLEKLAGLFASFVFGLCTIHLLLKVAKKINFGYFVLFFAVLVVISAFI